MEEFLSIKLIIVGDGTVGKSSLTQRFCKGTFTSEYKKTLGVDFLTKRRNINNTEVEYLIWDTAGQEYYDSITKRYYKGSHAAIIVFSVENIKSFQNISKWKEKIVTECGKIPLILVMNKVDLPEHLISSEEAEEIAKELRLSFFTASVKENTNINNIFEDIAIKIIQNLKLNKENINNELAINEEENQKYRNSVNEEVGNSYGLNAKNIIVNYKKQNNNDENGSNNINMNNKKGVKITENDFKKNKNKKKKKCCGSK